LKAVPQSKWEWFGHAGHFICGRWCRFHLATEVGKYFVSTVGLYVHPTRSGASERTEQEWLKDHPNGEEIGCGRFYETMVFPTGPKCDAEGCGCGMPVPVSHENLDFLGANAAGEARANHMLLCKKWASK